MSQTRNCLQCGKLFEVGKLACPACGFAVSPTASQPLSDTDKFVLEATGSLPTPSFPARHSHTVTAVPVVAKNNSKLHAKILIVAGLLFFLLLFGLAMNDKLPGGPPPVVTMAEFDQLRNGMSYEETCKIIGAEGKLTMTSRSMPFRAYTWKNDDGSTVTCQFMANRLGSRDQSALPETPE